MVRLQREVKILVVGSRTVGKTSMIKQFCRGIYDDEYKKTVGVDFMEKVQHIGSEDVKLMLWDTAGQDGFNSITLSYYKGAQAAVLVFSTTDRASFEALPAWRDRVRNECGDIAMAMFQNKADLIEQAAIPSEEIEAMARHLSLRLYRGCVREDLNVGPVFMYLVELVDRESNGNNCGAEKISGNGSGAPRPSLSMSESIKAQLQQQKEKAEKDQDCQIM